MATTLSAPETSELTDVSYSFEIKKFSRDEDGDLVVEGVATDGSVDSDRQVVLPSWSGPALKTWAETGANVRMAHDPQRPIGKGLRVDLDRDGDGKHWVRSVVVDPLAARLVEKGVLRAYSVGISSPVIKRDPSGAAPGGIIVGGEISELSIVDRPACKSAYLQIAKAAKDGTAELTGTLVAPDEILAKAAEPTVTKTSKGGSNGVNLTLPKNMSLSIKPTDLAKLATFKQKLVTSGGAEKAARPAVTKTVAPSAAKAVTPDEPDDALKSVMATETGVYKRDIDTATRRRLASEGNALSDGSYPIENTGDLSNAAVLARSGHGDVKGAKRLIGRRAKELGVPNPLKGGKDKKPATAAKAAEPEVTKCSCTGGMNGKVPCGECPEGARMAKRMAKKAKAKARMKVRKALTADVGKKKGKLRAICPGCGAKQNPAHVHCPECGGKLPASAPLVAKNHDFVCLGCGHELDKGEKHCPDCGKENPGYNAMADHKIPANQEKAAGARKDRVAKGKKKGKKAGKGEPFGGAQAAPFGSDGGEQDGDKKPPKVKKAAKPAPAAVNARKPGKGKKRKDGHKPTPGEAGGVPGTHEKPAPRHREPDGAEIEQFERDAHLEDGDDEKPTKLEAPTLQAPKSADPEMRAAIALKALGVPPDLGALHAYTCPAYHPETVAKAFPYPSFFSTIDTAAWQADMLGKTASAPMAEARAAMDLWQHAVTLKNASLDSLTGIRYEAHKAFRDANPGPGSFPEPGELSPQRFNRPYLSAGHSAPSPGQDPPHHASLPEVGGIASEDYTRPYLSAGHADESPQNEARGNGPMPAPERTGVPTSAPARAYYTNSAREGDRHAMTMIHDHIAHRFPDLCPMAPGAAENIGRKPVPTPHGVPGISPAPGTKKAAKKAAKVKKRAKVKAAKALAAKRRKLESRVLKGALTVEQARRKLGLKPVDPPQNPMATKAAAPVAAALDPEVIKAAITEATAPLAAQLAASQKAQKAQGKAFRKLQKTTDAIASQPDTSASPMRGVALHKTTTSAAPAGPLTVAQSAEQAQALKLMRLQDEWRNSNDPGRREAAYTELTQQLGVASMTPPASPIQFPPPMRT